MNRANKAFTLVELLVVIGIIAVLIGILLPALSRARDQAYTIQCQSNMRQLHNAFVLYSSMYNGYCLPAQASEGLIGGSGTDDWWLGVNTLGKALGIKGSNSQQILDRLAKILDCPVTKREKLPPPDDKFSFDYSYNSNLGDIRGMLPVLDPGNYASYNPAHAFKKWTQVPGNVLTLIESAEPLVKNDERFDTLGEITFKKAIGGQPHRQRSKGNVLFHDGSVYLCRIYTTKNNPRTGADPGYGTDPVARENALKAYTDLRDWMVMHPGHTVGGTLNSGGVQAWACWQKGLPIPNF
jgi:prepilin-type N-terminal cleavage/methylation domain-containing protein/prepilin-type processing-associated H-X9-DG protein